MMKDSRHIAELLLQSKAIKLEPATPFTWASGWKSPIYCDNRITLSYPQIRSIIRDKYVSTIEKHYPRANIIAGVATGGIAQAALIADVLDLPMVYVRSSAKKHGRENLVEGELQPNSKIVVIEDLISTGGSSLKAVNALREAGSEVVGMIATFTYGFDIAEQNFAREAVPLHTLTHYQALLEAALENNYISKQDLSLLEQWRKDPANWKGKLQ